MYVKFYQACEHSTLEQYDYIPIHDTQAHVALPATRKNAPIDALKNEYVLYRMYVYQIDGL